MILNKTTIFIDSTSGPRIITKYSLNWKGFLSILLAIALIIVTLLLITNTNKAEAVVTPEPEIIVRAVCYEKGANLCFTDMNGHIIAWMRDASQAELDKLKTLEQLEFDSSVEELFIVSKYDSKLFFIDFGGERLLVHADDMFTPSGYTDVLDPEFQELTNKASMEEKYLYFSLEELICK